MPEPTESTPSTSDAPLDALVAEPKRGDEPLTYRGAEVGATLRDFWSWACSDLISNAMRGVLAEYVVGVALGCVAGSTRLEWDLTDLRTPAGVRVEVKSSAYVQSWRQERLSTISFDIRPTLGWDAGANSYATERRRQADVYVFGVFTATDKAAADPLNLDSWDFYVMSTDRLNAAVGEQRSINLSSLLRHRPRKAAFGELAAVVDEIARPA
jgi:hypothetical protein